MAKGAHRYRRQYRATLTLTTVSSTDTGNDDGMQFALESSDSSCVTGMLFPSAWKCS